MPSGSGMSIKDIGYILERRLTQLELEAVPSPVSYLIPLSKTWSNWQRIWNRNWDREDVVGLTLAVTRHSMEVSGIDFIALTKLDVLDSLKK